MLEETGRKRRMNGWMESIGESEDPDPNLIWIYFFLLATVLHNALIQRCQSNVHSSILPVSGCYYYYSRLYIQTRQQTFMCVISSFESNYVM